MYINGNEFAERETDKCVSGEVENGPEDGTRYLVETEAPSIHLWHLFSNFLVSEHLYAAKN